MAAHRAQLQAAGIDPDAAGFEGEDGPVNEPMRRALELKARVQAEMKARRN